MRIQVDDLIDKYQNNLYSLSFAICKDAMDAEDIVQETFIAYYKSGREFESEEHIKAWLLKVTVNKSKNLILSFWRRNKIPLEEYMLNLPFEAEEDRGVFEAVMNLPKKYRAVVHLYYYEGYTVREIAAMTGTNENTIKTRLARARKLLKEKLQEAWSENE